MFASQTWLTISNLSSIQLWSRKYSIWLNIWRKYKKKPQKTKPKTRKMDSILTDIRQLCYTVVKSTISAVIDLNSYRILREKSNWRKESIISPRELGMAMLKEKGCYFSCDYENKPWQLSNRRSAFRMSLLNACSWSTKVKQLRLSANTLTQSSGGILQQAAAQHPAEMLSATDRQ